MTFAKRSIVVVALVAVALFVTWRVGASPGLPDANRPSASYVYR